MKEPSNKLCNIELKVKDNLFVNYKKPEDEIKLLFLTELKKSRNFDLIVGGSKIGPHKSDIIGINYSKKLNVDQFSTGQQKTIVLLIIIAQCKFLTEYIGRNPIILFDEVCSHLDEKNRFLLLELINSLNVQTIITGTERNFFSFLSTKATYCNISE